MKNNHPLPLINTQQVCNKLGISTSTLRRYVANGILPIGIKFNAQSNAWFEHEINQFITSRINGDTFDEQKELAQKLTAKRTACLNDIQNKERHDA